MSISVSGRQLDISFELSGLDAVGFEHEPRSPAEDEKVAAAFQVLQSPQEWLAPNAEAQCVRTFISITPNIFQTSHEHEHGHKKHGSTGEKGRPPSHADIDVQYGFVCDAPLRLLSLKFDLIERFPTLRGILVEASLPSGRSQAVLTTPHAEVPLAPTPAEDD